ncbi:P-loop containing nucleoside triphosphate hydrolase protein [Aspergillus karnatakaensis]|uniref:uncharacterized protein n=1 Tax=Aspergillus karnatakaensis TaxID=1810916 RepID=UPI003CCD7E4A
MNTQELLSPATQKSRPVVSFPASQSLQACASLGIGAISTGLPRLDDAICPPSAEGTDDVDPRGIPKGHVTEVFGPSGVGKTSLALNIVANALLAGGKVVWIDTGPPLPRIRLREILEKSRRDSESTETPEELAKNLVYIRAHSLPHLLALLLHTPANFPPDDCDLLVIDSASGPFPSYFPNPTELKARLSQSKTIDKTQVQWLMNRNSNVTSDLANQLTKLATTRQMAVLAINQTRTRIRGQLRATLCPVLSGGPWESTINTRIVLYRETTTTEEGDLRNHRYAEVMKRTGKLLPLRLEDYIISFSIEKDGLRAVDDDSSPRMAPLIVDERPEPATQRKRKVDEIADSQDEDDSDAEYGWVDEDGGLLEK